MLRALVADELLEPTQWGHLRVHSAFARAINLWAGGRLVTLGDPSVAAGPGTVILHMLPKNLQPGQTFVAADIDWSQARIWRPPSFPQRINREAVRYAGDHLETRHPRVNAFEQEILKRIASTDLHARPEAAAGLVGLGSGLTPTGDDYLAGFLLALGALAKREERGRIRSVINFNQTNEISRAMLREALRGRAVDPLHRLLGNLTPNYSPAAVEQSLTEVLSIGHTSGYALASGLLQGLRGAENSQKEGIDVDHNSRQAEHVH